MKSRAHKLLPLFCAAALTTGLTSSDVMAGGNSLLNVTKGNAKGRVTGQSQAFGKNHLITITDSDGIKTYSVYKNDGQNTVATDVNGKKQKNVAGGCSKKLRVQLDAIKSGSTFRVQYIDCKTAKSAWLVQNFFSNAQPGREVPWVDINRPGLGGLAPVTIGSGLLILD